MLVGVQQQQAAMTFRRLFSSENKHNMMKIKHFYVFEDCFLLEISKNDEHHAFLRYSQFRV